MKIAFLGDSITEGVIGVSFVDIIKERLPKTELSNYGVGGDTVSSLFKRIQTIEELHTYDAFVLFVGINDVFGKLSLPHRVFKYMKRQFPSKNTTTFKSKYNELLKYLLNYKKKVIVIPPLLIGEDVNSKWNHIVKEYADITQELSKFYKGITFLDLRNIFVQRLENKNISPYLPTSLKSIKRDIETLKTTPIIDSKSIERGLHLMLDGVHINSIGANIIAREIIFELQRLK